MHTDWTTETYASAIAVNAHRLLAAAEQIRNGQGSCTYEAFEEIHGLVGEIQHLAPPTPRESSPHDADGLDIVAKLAQCFGMLDRN